LGLSDIVTRANTDLFNKVRVNLGIAHSAYARDSSGQRIDQFLVNQGAADPAHDPRKCSVGKLI
jgi:hypothetical protein